MVCVLSKLVIQREIALFDSMPLAVVMLPVFTKFVIWLSMLLMFPEVLCMQLRVSHRSRDLFGKYNMSETRCEKMNFNII